MNTTNSLPVSWIAVDWGTSNLRVWVIGENGKIVAQRNSDKGMSSLGSSEFEPALMELISEFLVNIEEVAPPIEVGICGMAGAKEGWADAGYLSTPCMPPNASKAKAAISKDARISVRILPGIKQTSPADVMRGEETQIAGLLADNVDYNGVICLPGTHTKWVKIENGQISRFQTFMTGEVFSLLSNNSVLRHVVSHSGLDDEVFTIAILNSIKSPGTPVSQLFSLRAEALLNQLPDTSARAHLSGHLIGAEIEAARGFWEDQQVIICGDKSLAQTYCTALNLYGAKVDLKDASALTLAGLKMAFGKRLEEQYA